MKKDYKSLELSIIRLSGNDIITQSGPETPIDIDSIDDDDYDAD